MSKQVGGTAIIMLYYGPHIYTMQDEFGDTALMEACDAGHVDTAALLIDKGARVDYKNKVCSDCLLSHI